MELQAEPAHLDRQAGGSGRLDRQPAPPGRASSQDEHADLGIVRAQRHLLGSSPEGHRLAAEVDEPLDPRNDQEQPGVGVLERGAQTASTSSG